MTYTKEVYLGTSLWIFHWKYFIRVGTFCLLEWTYWPEGKLGPQFWNIKQYGQIKIWTPKLNICHFIPGDVQVLVVLSLHKEQRYSHLREVTLLWSIYGIISAVYLKRCFLIFFISSGKKKNSKQHLVSYIFRVEGVQTLINTGI